ESVTQVPGAVVVFFFFSSRRRHTRSDRDWSSDVCSSDLSPRRRRHAQFATLEVGRDFLLTGAGASVRFFTGIPVAELACIRSKRSEERRVGKEGRSRWWAAGYVVNK